MAKFKYWLPAHGMTIEDSYEVDSENTHPRYIAQDAADDFHSNHDGWESKFPVKITIQLQNGTERTYDVDRDYDPVFYASEAR